ncbi:MAG TPA: MerR family transcriptional regulator, partial [Thermoanaerobacterales bacterium]|nr:MerR family transcriptional regulator [Thermoanaerobacterales bacterium]
VANAGVLFIDDLFKSSIQNYYQRESIDMNDLREIFKVINYRYNKGLPILLNSEIHFERFKELDQAIIGRINEMCQYKYLVSIKPDINKNYRLTKKSR